MKKLLAFLLIIISMNSCNKTSVSNSNDLGKIEDGNGKLEERLSSTRPQLFYSAPSMYADGVLTEAEMRAFMISTRNQILLQYGYDIYNDIPSNDPAIATVGLLLPGIVQASQLGYVVSFTSNSASIASQAKNAQKVVNPNKVGDPRGDAVYCAGESLGVGWVFNQTGGAIIGKLFIKAAIKSAAKVATRALGPISWGLAAWDFGSCMGWV